MKTNNQVIIMSVSKGIDDRMDASNSSDFLMYLRKNNFNYNAAWGCYKGTIERSFVILINNDQEFEMLASVASRFNQESILHQDANGIARLIFMNESRTTQVLGRLQQVNSTKNLEAYTELNNKIYAIV